ncbi:MAE_28990/MAE_18760 family HEPN-like nuclease [Microcoleus sp. LAD1_D5]|uniref:MAE_28990/MAE_18760 family HEPN-like nuclease n=1 Tax=unclassified Microcoleus TaxID=2642155 RepID=UPI002FD3D75F
MSKKNRTLLDLQDNLDEDFGWRIKELSLLKSKIPNTPNRDALQDALIRAGIAMLYAHWEGFVKCAAENYLNYVSLKKFRHAQLESCFVALCLKNKINEMDNTNKFDLQTAAVDFMLQQLNERANIPYEGIIQTKSNLSFIVFRDICTVIGIDYKKYQLRETLIDKQLLQVRNTIAHGKYLSMNFNEYQNVYDTVIATMREIKDDIMNAAATEKFKRS